MDPKIIVHELQFKAVRSSGPGGQHVNKVSSKITLSFDIAQSVGLHPEEKERLFLKLQSRLTKDQLLILQCNETRSQHQNKNLVIQRFFELIKNALHVPKKRKATKRSKASVEKRLLSKKKAAQKKANRKRPDLD